MSMISADRLNTLKAKVKAECLRRQYTGSVAAYGGTAYDYTVAPATGGVARKEHYEKLAVPMNAINATDTPATDGARIISESEIAAMETKVAAYAQRSIYDTSGTDCSASCTGMCYSCTSCTSCSGCSGCGDACTSCTGCSGCSGSCTDACTGSCSGCYGCGMGCATACTTGCTGCTGTCQGCSSCSGTCFGCSDTCTGGCKWNCAGGCTSCSGGCGASCTGTCSGGNTK